MSIDVAYGVGTWKLDVTLVVIVDAEEGVYDFVPEYEGADFVGEYP